jgi:hypothetical protein
MLKRYQFLILELCEEISDIDHFKSDAWRVICIACELTKPKAVAARSKARTVFARSNTVNVGSNHIRGMDVCVRLFCD